MVWLIIVSSQKIRQKIILLVLLPEIRKPFLNEILCFVVNTKIRTKNITDSNPSLKSALRKRILKLKIVVLTWKFQTENTVQITCHHRSLFELFPLQILAYLLKQFSSSRVLNKIVINKLFQCQCLETIRFKAKS